MPGVIEVQKQAARKSRFRAVDFHVRPKLDRHPVTIDKRASHSHPNVALRGCHRFPVRLDAGPALVGILKDVRPVGSSKVNNAAAASASPFSQAVLYPSTQSSSVRGTPLLSTISTLFTPPTTRIE